MQATDVARPWRNERQVDIFRILCGRVRSLCHGARAHGLLQRRFEFADRLLEEPELVRIEPLSVEIDQLSAQEREMLRSISESLLDRMARLD